MKRNRLLAVIVTLACVAAGCSTKAVRCDGKLTPINAPAPVTKDVPTPLRSTP